LIRRFEYGEKVEQLPKKIRATEKQGNEEQKKKKYCGWREEGRRKQSSINE